MTHPRFDPSMLEPTRRLVAQVPVTAGAFVALPATLLPGGKVAPWQTELYTWALRQAEYRRGDVWMSRWYHRSLN